MAIVNFDGDFPFDRDFADRYEELVEAKDPLDGREYAYPVKQSRKQGRAG